jgi:hypothetical protein
MLKEYIIKDFAERRGIYLSESLAGLWHQLQISKVRQFDYLIENADFLAYLDPIYMFCAQFQLDSTYQEAWNNIQAVLIESADADEKMAEHYSSCLEVLAEKATGAKDSVRPDKILERIHRWCSEELSLATDEYERRLEEIVMSRDWEIRKVFRELEHAGYCQYMAISLTGSFVEEKNMAN